MLRMQATMKLFVQSEEKGSEQRRACFPTANEAQHPSSQKAAPGSVHGYGPFTNLT